MPLLYSVNEEGGRDRGGIAVARRRTRSSARRRTLRLLATGVTANESCVAERVTTTPYTYLAYP